MKFFSFLKYTPFSEISQGNYLMTASGRGHRRRSIRFPAAKDRALRGALGEGHLAPGFCPNCSTYS